MKKRFIVSNRRGAARRGVGFSLFVLIGMSTLLGFASTILTPTQVIAAGTPDLTEAQAQDIQMLSYFQDCLKNRISEKGTGSNGAFRGFYEVFQNYSDGQDTKTGQQVIVVGPGIDGKGGDGVWACESIAKRAISIYKPELNDNDYQDYLMRAIWGKSYADNDGQPVKVSAAKVRSGRDKLAASVGKLISERKAKGSLRYATLKRFGPLLSQCYKNWSSSPPDGGGKNDDQRLSYRKRKVYAEVRTFDWKDINIVTISQSARNGQRDKYGLLGNIVLKFKTTFGNVTRDGRFSDRNSDWFPIGDDVGKSIIGDDYYKQHYNQSFLDCNWIKQHGDYLFDQSAANKYYFVAKDGKPWIYKTTVDENGKEVQSEVEAVDDATTDGGKGSNNYQCVVAPPLSWIACPIITLMVSALDTLEGAIIQAVQVPPLTTDGPFEGLHTTWAGFRDVANALLVLVFLITIFAQVLPFDIDPYMVKKVLPKLIAAAICIQFSYFIVQVMFDISRVLGQGVATLIQSFPVSDIGGGLFGQSAGNATATSTLGLVGAVAAGTAAGAAAVTAGTALIVPVLLLLLAGLLSVVTLFVTLQMRMIVIIILTIVAPLAFLAWVLPNTEGYFKKWFTGLIKLLLMYPIIVFMVQSVNLISNISYEALAAMAGSNEGGAGGVSDISKLMVSIIPIVVYFMIPMTFKWAGGIFSTIAGAIQTQGGRLSKQSRRAAGKSLEEARHKAGERLKDTGPLAKGEWRSPGKAFRRFGARTASGNIFSFGDVGRRKIKQTEQKAYSAVAESIQDTLRGKNNKRLLDEDFAHALKEGEITRATAIADLVLQQGGDLEMEQYFRGLEWEGGKVDGTRTGKVTRNPETGAVEQVDDPIWQQLTKMHGASLAAKLPHTVGKPILQASPDQLINSKGEHPAWELQQEIEAQRAIYDANKGFAEGSDKWKVAQKAKAKIVRAANNFYTASQKEGASEMGDDMVKTWQNVAGKIDDLGLEFGGVGAKDFIERQTAGGSLKRYVQGTPPAGSPPSSGGTPTTEEPFDPGPGEDPVV